MDTRKAAEILAFQERLYPELRVRDKIKCLYQSEFGCGHMVKASADGLAFLLREAENAPAVEEPAEDLGMFCRVHLGGLDALGLSPDELYALFVRSAETAAGGMKDFLADLMYLKETNPADAGEIDAYIAEGCPSVHHSEAFRAAYRPAYRVVSKELLNAVLNEKMKGGN